MLCTIHVTPRPGCCRVAHRALGRRSGKALHPYVSVWLADGKSGSRRGEKQLSDVAADTDSPVWEQTLSPWVVSQPDMELVLQVREAEGMGASGWGMPCKLRNAQHL